MFPESYPAPIDRAAKRERRIEGKHCEEDGAALFMSHRSGPLISTVDDIDGNIRLWPRAVIEFPVALSVLPAVNRMLEHFSSLFAYAMNRRLATKEGILLPQHLWIFYIFSP